MSNALTRSGLMQFLCRAALESDRQAALKAAAKACLGVPKAQRAWAKLQSEEAEALRDEASCSALPYGVEVPVELAGDVCGTVGLAAGTPVNGPAHRKTTAVAEFLSMWESRRRLSEFCPQHAIVGCSAELQKVELLAQRLAPYDEPVLIQGETGVGKELIARSVHCLSPRREQPLWTVNCAAVLEELLVSELFGHRRGAFTGAIRDQRGRFEVADDATLFLDEVGDMGPNLQAVLLRVIEYGEIQQLGDEGKSRRINVRVIAASNRDLAGEVAAGRFRGDLYFRLSPLMIRVPALRERPEDIPVLARHFVHQLEEEWDQSLELVQNAIESLVGYPFPGNVRELRNLILRAAATCAEGRIEQVFLPRLPFAAIGQEAPSVQTNGNASAHSGGNGSNGKGKNGNGHARADGVTKASDVSDRISTPVAASDRDGDAGGNGYVNGNGHANGSAAETCFDGTTAEQPWSGFATTIGDDVDMSLDAITAAHLRRVLAITEGNVSRAARMLQIPRTTLQSKLQRYGVMVH